MLISSFCYPLTTELSNRPVKPTMHPGELTFGWNVRNLWNSRSSVLEKKIDEKQLKLGLRRQVEGGKPGPGGAASEGVLANFFNSLLNKKSGTGAAMGRGGTAVRSDAAAELDRMNRAKKIVPQGNAANDTTESS